MKTPTLILLACLCILPTALNAADVAEGGRAARSHSAHCYDGYAGPTAAAILAANLAFLAIYLGVAIQVGGAIRRRWLSPA